MEMLLRPFPHHCERWLNLQKNVGHPCKNERVEELVILGEAACDILPNAFGTY
jgi:hypothetical protein